MDRFTTVGLVCFAVTVAVFLGRKTLFNWMKRPWFRHFTDADILGIGSGMTVQLIYKPLYPRLFDQDWTPTRRAEIGRLVWFDDLSHNSSKAERYRALREKIRTRCKPSDLKSVVYLKRGQSGETRQLINEDTIIQTLEETPLDVTIAALIDCQLVIGVEGSHLSHAVYTLQPKGGVLVIQPPSRFYNAHKDWVDSLGMHYGFVVGDAAERGFSLSVNDLLRTIELMIRATR